MTFSELLEHLPEQRYSVIINSPQVSVCCYSPFGALVSFLRGSGKPKLEAQSVFVGLSYVDLRDLLASSGSAIISI